MKYNKYLLIAFIVLCLIIAYQTIIVNNVVERFEEKIDGKQVDGKKKETASEALMKALGNTIKAANTIGKKMLNPDLWVERMKLINKSPMDLARMHMMSNS